LSDELWLIVRFLHVLAMAFFVGGQLVLVAAVLPVQRGAAERPWLATVGRRFGYGTLVAIAVLVATGVPLADHLHRWDDGKLQLKLTFVVAVGLLTWWHLRRPRAHALQGAIFVLSLAIVWLGLRLAHGPY
jgi:uncharacterized membrane protein